MAIRKKLDELTVEDLANHPIWEMVEDARESDVLVEPVDRIPAETMKNRLAGVQLRLADGTRSWALLSNIAPNNPLSTRHFLTVSVHDNGKWFDLARYHDVDFARRNGVALAKFLGKQVADVFPIEYDLTALIKGERDSLAGAIPHEVDARLSEDELIRLSLDDL